MIPWWAKNDKKPSTSIINHMLSLKDAFEINEADVATSPVILVIMSGDGVDSSFAKDNHKINVIIGWLPR